MGRLAVIPIGLLLAVVATGCGEGGAASGATVSVYVAAPRCAEARAELARAGGEAGDLKVRAVCLAPTESSAGAALAVVGADARRATEDSTSVAFLETPGPAARFARPIVESAHLAWIQISSGKTAMHQVLEALEERGTSSPRDAVRKSLQPS